MKYLIIIILSFLLQFNHPVSQSLTLKASDDKITEAQLSYAAHTMVTRLKLIDIDANAQVNVAGRTITIQSNSDLGSSWAHSLITDPGHLEILQGIRRGTFLDILDPHDPLYKLLDTTRNLFPELPRIQEEVLGTFPHSTKEEVLSELERINKSGILKEAKLSYYPGNDESEESQVFILRSPEADALIVREDIIKISIDKGVNSDMQILIELSGDGGKAFATLTKKNINHIIAIVLDDEILMAPRVADTILEDKIRISGEFSEAEAKYFHAILQGEELPCRFNPHCALTRPKNPY